MTTTTKVCTGCRVEKPLEAFSKHAKGKFGRNPKCKNCKNEQAGSFYRANRDAVLARQKEQGRATGYDRKRKYGLSPDEYLAMLEAQGGVCAICGENPEDRALSVDHNHRTGAVRGLLCRFCNIALGFMRDDPQRLRNAAGYLER